MSYLQPRGHNFNQTCHIANIEVRGAILGHWGPQGLDFLTMLAPGAGPAK